MKKRARVFLVGADGKRREAVGITVRAPNGILVTCEACPPGPNSEKTGFFVDPLDRRLPDGPFHCEVCTKRLAAN